MTILGHNEEFKCGAMLTGYGLDPPMITTFFTNISHTVANLIMMMRP